MKKYGIDAVVDRYMDAVESIVNIQGLMRAFDTVVESGRLQVVMDEIVVQAKLEFNYSQDED